MFCMKILRELSLSVLAKYLFIVFYFSPSLMIFCVLFNSAFLAGINCAAKRVRLSCLKCLSDELILGLLSGDTQLNQVIQGSKYDDVVCKTLDIR